MIKQKAVLLKPPPRPHGFAWYFTGDHRRVASLGQIKEILAAELIIVSALASLWLVASLFIVLMTGFLAFMTSKWLIRHKYNPLEEVTVSLELKKTFAESIAVFDNKTLVSNTALPLLKNMGTFDDSLQQRPNETVITTSERVTVEPIEGVGDGFETILAHFEEYELMLESSRNQVKDEGTIKRRFSRAFSTIPAGQNSFFSVTAELSFFKGEKVVKVQTMDLDKSTDDGLNVETFP